MFSRRSGASRWRYKPVCQWVCSEHRKNKGDRSLCDRLMLLKDMKNFFFWLPNDLAESHLKPGITLAMLRKMVRSIFAWTPPKVGILTPSLELNMAASFSNVE